MSLLVAHVEMKEVSHQKNIPLNYRPQSSGSRCANSEDSYGGYLSDQSYQYGHAAVTDIIHVAIGNRCNNYNIVCPTYEEKRLGGPYANPSNYKRGEGRGFFVLAYH